MKLGNRKVVIGGLTAVAFTSLTAFTNVTPDTTSDTNHMIATPSVLYQNLAMAKVGGISNFSSLFMPGQVTTTLDAITADATLSGSKTPVNAQAGIAKLFTQSVTMDSLGTVVTKDSAQSTTLSKAALNNDNVGEESQADTQENAQAEVESDETVTDSESEITEEISGEQTQEAADTATEESQADTNQEEAEPETTESQTDESKPQTDETESDTTEAETDQAEETEEAEQNSEWADKAMAKVDKSVNIRAEANEEAQVVGKLYKGAEADIIEKGDEWTKISSGSVEEGYVKNDFLAFGDEAEALAAQDGTLVAIVNTDALRIRSEASEDASVLDLAENGEELTAVAEDGDWVEIQYTSDSSAFVASQYVTLDYVLGKALTIEEEEAMIAEQKRKEAEARMAEIAASEEAALLAAVVRMEAGGESYEGKLAVASVVVNRIRSGRYPNTVSEVVYQSGQFPGAGNGTLANFLAGGVGGDCKKAAVEALAGITNVEYLHFNSVSRIGTNGYVIGNHCFY
jgi:SH3-like domain-containing protein